MTKQALGRSILKAKAILCIALMLNLSFWIGGCGQSSSPLAVPGAITIPIEPGGPLAESLESSVFFDATAVEIVPDAQTFRFVFPDDYRRVSGKYTQTAGRFAVTELRLEQGAASMTLYLDTAWRVTAIADSNGERWDRPGHWDSAAAGGSDDLSAFLAANSELVSFAWSMDVQAGKADPNQPPPGGSDGDPIPVKDAAALLGPPGIILHMLAALWAPFAIILPMLLGLFGILAGVQGLLALFCPISGPEHDCNQNGVEDATDIANETSQDCNENDIPDECDIADGTANDCNHNGVPDSCDLAAGTVQDCNKNDIPDVCDLAADTASDCNVNGVPDSCDIAAGTSQDCDENGTPDECDDDTDQDGVPDGCDICPSGDDALDDDADGVPDACDACPGFDDAIDEDGDGAPDECDICPGFDDNADADGDGNPDGCDPCPADNPDDPDGDFACTSEDNCPDTYNPDQTDTDGDQVGDACDQEACCLPDQVCAMLTQADCLAQSGVFMGWDTDCETVDCGLELTVEADETFIYENLSSVTPPCPVIFSATVVDDPFGNTSYSYEWSFDVPTDIVRPEAEFGIVSGAGTEQLECEAPDRPAYSSSGQQLWKVHCVATGDQFGNQGEAILDFQVRILGDANGDGCTDTDDQIFFSQVKADPDPDPADFHAADVNCDGLLTAVDSAFISAVVTNADTHGSGNCGS
ncbi:MAG: hypothetical protein ABII12_03660 [Planctomycetota bacterium]